MEDFFSYNEKRERKNNSIKTLNLCFEGGGIAGLSYAGVSKALKEYNIKQKRIVASSAGSIFAGLIACNATPDFIEEIIKSTDFTYFMDGWGWRAGLCYRMAWKMGMYNGEYFLNWYSGLLKKLGINESITLQEIYEKFNTDLIITTTDIVEEKTIYLNREKNGSLQLKQAVRMSMSIPIFYVPVYHENKFYIDGGYLDNYPIDYLDMYYPQEPAIGFKLVGKNVKKIKFTGWDDYVSALLHSAVNKIESLNFREDDKSRTVLIDTFDVSTIEFNISPENIDKLIESGYKSTCEFLEKFIEVSI